MKYPPFLRSQRGDTIVEVLISIAVVSLILGGAFVAANQNLKGTRAAQERQNALKLSESEVEQIKYVSGTNPDAIFGPSVPAVYCMVASVAIAASDPRCTVNSAGAPSTVVPAYHVEIRRSVNDFTIKTTWESARGSGGNDNVELKYRAYR